MKLGSSSPAGTNSSTSAMVIFPAIAIIGLKFLAVALNTKLPSVSPFHAFTIAKSAVNADSRMCGFPLKMRTSFPSATSVPNPAGVKKAGIPAPPARHLSAKDPCGIRSTSSSPDNICLSNSSFSPT